MVSAWSGPSSKQGHSVARSWCQWPPARDTRTLWGGKGFLASLALSDLFSHQRSIDLPFWDEGFGSLDSDTLQSAPATLNGRNASGKMIGVISHVERP